MQGAIAGHHLKIKKLLTRWQERGIKLNKQKEAFKQTELPYIGHLLTSEGDPSKIEAVLNMERRTVLHRKPSKVSAEAVRSFGASQATHKEGHGISAG